MREEIFESYRAAHPDVGEGQLEALNLLQSDDRMSAVWESFEDYANYALATIMNCYRLADIVPDKTNRRDQLSADFSALNAAEALLRDHFSRFLPVASSSPPAHIIERDEKMLSVQAALDYVKVFLHEEEASHRFFMSRFSPASRNAGNPVHAFTTMLCNEFNAAFGDPRYECVATIASVIYDKALSVTEAQKKEERDALSVEAIKKRYRLDRTNRKNAGQRPWSPFNGGEGTS